MTTVARKSKAVLYVERAGPYADIADVFSSIKGTPLSPDELRKIDAYWRTSLYLCLGKPVAA